jgi:hypothetical protein
MIAQDANERIPRFPQWVITAAEPAPSYPPRCARKKRTISALKAL